MVTSFDIYKLTITKLIIIININCSKKGVTILMLMYEIDRCGITKVETITEDAIKNRYVIRTMVVIIYFMLIPIMNEVKKMRWMFLPTAYPCL